MIVGVALATAATYAGDGFDPALLGRWEAGGVVERDALGQLVEAWRGRQVARVAMMTMTFTPSVKGSPKMRTLEMLPVL